MGSTIRDWDIRRLGENQILEPHMSGRVMVYIQILVYGTSVSAIEKQNINIFPKN